MLDNLKNEPNFSKAKFSFLIIGKKANDIISKTENVISNHSDIFENINYDDTASMVDSIIELFSNGEFDHVELIYNTFKNAANQTTITEHFLPISKPEGTEALSDYIFEPSMEQIVSDLVPKSLKIQLYKAIRDSFAGEHGARMMKSWIFFSKLCQSHAQFINICFGFRFHCNTNNRIRKNHTF